MTSPVYQLTDQVTKDYAQTIMDLASQVSDISFSNLSLLNENGALTHFVEVRDVDDISIDTLIRQVTGPDQVYQASIVGTASTKHFFAGVALYSQDSVWVGALWGIDQQAVTLTGQQQQALTRLGDQLMKYLSLVRENQDLALSKVNFQRFNDLFNYSSEIHCITDGEGHIKYINDSIYDLLGYLPEEVMDKTIWDFCTEGERDRVMPYITNEISQGKDRFQVQTKTLTKHGELKWFEWSDVIKDSYWLVNGRDITQRKQADLRAKVLTLAVEKSAAGVFIRDRNNKITWMNESMEYLIGYSLKELKGQMFAKLLLGKASDISIYEYAAKMTAENQPYKVEILCYKKDGSPIWLFISNTPLFNDLGELEQYVGVAFDITERKEVEAQLIKTKEEAINLGLAKENFLAVMSHELRTPLNGVIGAARLLANEEHSEHQEETLQILQFSAQNLLTLINDVLDFTKIETGNMLLESEPLDLQSLVEKTVHSLKPKANEQGISLSCEFDPGLPNLLYGDSTRLYQILINLAGNAVKFTAKGQVIIKLSLEEKGTTTASIRFDIIDTGIGIAPDKLDAIFDAYTQAGAETSRKYGGTGLGLAITKKLVQLYGSEIKVTSTLGEGTNFFFTITFKKIDPFTVSQPLSPSILDDLRGHVLVVEDSAMNRLIAQRILTKWKLSVDLAEDGVQALEKIQSQHYDLVLMDIHMPGMDGFETVKTLRRLKDIKYQALPVIALTGSVFAEHEMMIREAGMNDFVLKPFDAALLYRKIKHLLGPANDAREPLA